MRPRGCLLCGRLPKLRPVAGEPYQLEARRQCFFCGRQTPAAYDILMYLVAFEHKAGVAQEARFTEAFACHPECVEAARHPDAERQA